MADVVAIVTERFGGSLWMDNGAVITIDNLGASRTYSPRVGDRLKWGPRYLTMGDPPWTVLGVASESGIFTLREVV